MGYCCVKKSVTQFWLSLPRNVNERGTSVLKYLFMLGFCSFSLLFLVLCCTFSRTLLCYVCALWRLRNVALCLLEKWFLQTITIFLRAADVLSVVWHEALWGEAAVGTIEALLCKSTSEWCAVGLVNVWKQAIYVKVKTIWLPEWRGWEFKSLCLSLHFLWLLNDFYCISFYSITSSQTWN